MGSGRTGFRNSSSRALEWAPQSWRVGFVAPQHVEFSWTRDWSMCPALAGGFLSSVPSRKSFVIYIFAYFEFWNMYVLHKLIKDTLSLVLGCRTEWSRESLCNWLLCFPITSGARSSVNTWIGQTRSSGRSPLPGPWGKETALLTCIIWGLRFLLSCWSSWPWISPCDGEREEVECR